MNTILTTTSDLRQEEKKERGKNLSSLIPLSVLLKNFEYKEINNARKTLHQKLQKDGYSFNSFSNRFISNKSDGNLLRFKSAQECFLPFRTMIKENPLEAQVATLIFHTNLTAVEKDPLAKVTIEHSYIAKKLGFCTKTIQRTIDSLKEKGWLLSSRTKCPESGHYRGNNYSFSQKVFDFLLTIRRTSCLKKIFQKKFKASLTILKKYLARFIKRCGQNWRKFRDTIFKKDEPKEAQKGACPNLNKPTLVGGNIRNVDIPGTSEDQSLSKLLNFNFNKESKEDSWDKKLSIWDGATDQEYGLVKERFREAKAYIKNVCGWIVRCRKERWYDEKVSEEASEEFVEQNREVAKKIEGVFESKDWNSSYTYFIATSQEACFIKGGFSVQLPSYRNDPKFFKNTLLAIVRKYYS